MHSALKVGFNDYEGCILFKFINLSIYCNVTGSMKVGPLTRYILYMLYNCNLFFMTCSIS